MKNSYGLAYIPVSGQAEAERIARICIAEKLAACINILPAIHSFYRWKGKTQKEQEVLVLMKTRADVFKKLSAVIKKHHSYECPCIVFLPFSKVYPAYAKWMTSELVQPNSLRTSGRLKKSRHTKVKNPKKH